MLLREKHKKICYLLSYIIIALQTEYLNILKSFWWFQSPYKQKGISKHHIYLSRLCVHRSCWHARLPARHPHAHRLYWHVPRQQLVPLNQLRNWFVRPVQLVSWSERGPADTLAVPRVHHLCAEELFAERGPVRCRVELWEGHGSSVEHSGNRIFRSKAGSNLFRGCTAVMRSI